MSLKTYQILINESSAKFLRTLALRHIEASFMFTSVPMTDPRLHQGALTRNFSSCRLRSSGATCFLMSFTSITKKPGRTSSAQIATFLALPAIVRDSGRRGGVRESPASTALDLSNESDRLARLAEALYLQCGALLQQIGHAS